MFNKIRGYLRWQILKRAGRWPEHAIIVIPVVIYEGIKDDIYWGAVRSVLLNKPFVNELIEFQTHLEAKLGERLQREPFNPQAMRDIRQQLYGLKGFMYIISQKAREEEERYQSKYKRNKI